MDSYGTRGDFSACHRAKKAPPQERIGAFWREAQMSALSAEIQFYCGGRCSNCGFGLGLSSEDRGAPTTCVVVTVIGDCSLKLISVSG